MTKERIRFIFGTLVILVMLVALMIQVLGKQSVVEDVAFQPVLIPPPSTQVGNPDLRTKQQTPVVEKTVMHDDCVVAGCSNQVCTDDLSYHTDCQWHETYSCYNAAVCERQPDGECGWTRTPEIMQCLAKFIPDLAPDV